MTSADTSARPRTAVPTPAGGISERPTPGGTGAAARPDLAPADSIVGEAAAAAFEAVVRTDALRRCVAMLRGRRETFAVAESLTGGLVSAVITGLDGVSEVFRGGLVVYATDLKSELASVDPALLAEHGAVHPDVAAQLADGARQRCRADWGVGLTGVAGPSAQDGVVPGTVHVAVCGPTRRLVRSARLDGDRATVRIGAAELALGLLAEAMTEDVG